MSTSHPLVGTVQQVFDADAWRAAGGDVGDNSCFWKPAMIVSVTMHPNDEATAKVAWEHGRTTSGHFINMMNHGKGAGEFKGVMDNSEIQPWTGAMSEETHHPAEIKLSDEQVRAAMRAHFASMGLELEAVDVVRTGPWSYSMRLEERLVGHTTTGEPGTGRTYGVVEPAASGADSGHQRLTTNFNNPPLQLYWEIEGIAHIEVEQTMKANRYNVQSLWVEPEYQNLGIGTALMRIVLHEADQAGVELWVVPQPLTPDLWEPLVRFYMRLGFEWLGGSGYMRRISPTTDRED